MPTALRAPARRLLALDTAGSSCGVAVWSEGQVAAARFVEMSRGQSERLVPLALDALIESGLGFADLQAIAVTRGPGGFTGLRIGLAAAAGFAKAWSLPILGFDSFTAHAAGIDADEAAGRRALILLDGKRRELFVQLRDRPEQPTADAFAAAPEELPDRLPQGPLLLIGDAVAAAAGPLRDAGFAVRIARAAGSLRPETLARLAAQRQLPAAGEAPPLPIYLRPPDTTVAKAPT